MVAHSVVPKGKNVSSLFPFYPLPPGPPTISHAWPSWKVESTVVAIELVAGAVLPVQLAPVRQLQRQNLSRKRENSLQIGAFVRPAKAGAFSGSYSRRGKSQSPVAWIARRRETE